MSAPIALAHPKVVMPAQLGSHAALAERLRARGCDVVALDTSDMAQVRSALAEADILLVAPWQSYVFDAELLGLAGRLRAVNSLVIGVETIDVEACTDAGVAVGNGAVAENFLGVAEATVMLMLQLTLDARAKERAMREGRFRPPTTRSRLLNTQTIGLIGLGRVGRAVVERLQGWNVRLLGYDPFVNGAPPSVELVELETLLRESDIVSVHVALTKQSRNLIGARELSLMRPSAYLLNTARGKVVDEQALADALNAGRLAGAAIDTWAQEPPSPDNPLLRVDPDKIIVTGHSIAHSARLPALLMDAAEDNVLREARGELPTYLVNPQVEPRWRARLAALAAAAPA